MTIDRFADTNLLRVLVFTSPKAGSGKHREQIPRLVDLLRQHSVDVHVTHKVSELQALASQTGPQPAVIVPAGGDGTLSLAAGAVSTPAQQVTERRPLIAPMPLGTENLLARHFGHSAIAEQVIQTIRHGVPYPLDVGTANDQTFLIMATCGFDAEVVRAMHLTRSGHINRFSYFRPILHAMRRYRFPAIQVRIDDNEPVECRWAMVFNLPCYGGGLSIEPDAVGNDGLFDVILFRGGSIPSGLKYATTIWTGQHLKLRDVVRCRGSQITIESTSRVPYQLDGDYAGRLPLKIEMHPASTVFLTPPSTSSPSSVSSIEQQTGSSNSRPGH
ncbi:MAG: diacylglycerol kinase family lipid kinase [Rubripirellula sp.]|nr:diacylglycerol kinase family lipid kinase [Rubripirellula sp.]